MILLVIDSRSKWVEAVPLKHATAGTTITIMTRCDIFRRSGIPCVIISDNGPQFTSYEFKAFLQRNTIRHFTTAPYYPQSSGLAEHTVSSVKTALQKNRKGSLAAHLSRYLYTYRHTPLPSGKYPAELLMGSG